MTLRPATVRRGLVERRGQVVILEGDETLISGIDGALGIRFDAERNDLAAITARFAAEGVDAPAILVLFTTFEDLGAGGPSYFVPLFNDTAGTGMGPIDQRAEFGVAALVGVVDLKQRSTHGQRLGADASHELAHRHLAYFPPVTPSSSTVAIDLLGRQRAHWHALLDSDGSLMGGHELRALGAGRFVVVSRNVRFSSLDLYALGLARPDEVGPFFFIAGGRTEGGAWIPGAAELPPGTVILGTEVALSIEEVVEAAGPRDSAGPEGSRMAVLFALLTRPGESATSTAVIAEAEAIDAARDEIGSTWETLTRGRGTLCTRLDGCPALETPDAGRKIEGGDSDCRCTQGARGEGAGHGAPALLLAIVLRAIPRRRRIRCRALGRSCGRSSRRG